MISERAIGRASLDDPSVDWIDIDWMQTLRRAMRLVSGSGRKVNVILGPGNRLCHLDVIARDGETSIAIRVNEIDALVVKLANVDQAARVALELGNQHSPVEVIDGTLYCLDDGPTREILARFGAEFAPCRHRLQPAPIAASTILDPRFR